MSDIRGLSQAIREIVTVTGVVQGVGFRPFIYRLARSHGLTGSVANTAGGVEIDIEGPAGSIDGFISAVAGEAPPRARITCIRRDPAPPAGSGSFRIIESDTGSDSGSGLLVSPDSCTCPQCIEEMNDPADRRYRYPFINCTNCGPRFTIIEGLPYDRPLTTMRRFAMCPDCQAEYDDPADRRFHAEPNACPACGPQLWLADSRGGRIAADDPVKEAARALLSGSIVALKGLGGFQLACLATDRQAVQKLRLRKQRPDKPFAVMMTGTDDADLYCRVSTDERQLLESPERPAVLLGRLPGGDIAPDVAPGLNRLGVMLPCSPLHFLLMEEAGAPLVMTSGNLSEEPICRTNDEAASRLGGIADLFLFHDREICSTYDDSVVMVAGGGPVMIRRARGYAPLPQRIPYPEDDPGREIPSVLATGAELKNTFCLTRGDQAFLSQHIGDLKDAETLLFYERTVSLYERMLSVTPCRFICDSHPDYLSTAYCRERAPEPRQSQHHQAHAASCLAENGHTAGAVCVALDGTGFGDDGKIWGGEFFTGSLAGGFKRAAHFDYMPLPGSEAAIREPWRTAMGAIWRFVPDGLDTAARHLGLKDRNRDLLAKQLWAGLNSPQTSSCGRLFDAVAALALKRMSISYEAQAAMELEAVAGEVSADDLTALLKSPQDLSYRFGINRERDPWTISPAPVLEAVLSDACEGKETAAMARNFHLGLAAVIVQVSTELAEIYDLDAVALSGGVFQNALLLELVSAGLADKGLDVLCHRHLPAGDGGISYGQAMLAIHQDGRK